MAKKIQYGAASFKEIVKTSSLYIDKTSKIYDLITQGSRRFFLSRPRRFGKTLLVDTLSEIFQGNKELFKGLAIYDTDYDWTPYPIIRLSLSTITATNAKDLNKELIKKVTDFAETYGYQLNSTFSSSCGDYLSDLFKYFKKIDKQVVVLIDEYDYPILKNIDLGTSLLEEIRETLKGFYAILKDNTNYIRFLFLTGVGRFSKTSIFSGINDLLDISSSDKYADLLGYTQEEVEHYFAPYIDDGAAKLKLTRQQFIDEVKDWYDGYRFSDSDINVYNPSSINMFFESETYRFNTYWISTGTPEFLVKILSKKEHSGFDIQQELLKERTDFLEDNELNLSNLNLITLLYQSGYVTVKNYNPIKGRYTLGFPNREVRKSFLSYLAEAFLNTSREDLKSYHGVEDALLDRDPNKFIEEIGKFFQTVPMSPRPTREFTFQVAILALLYNSKQLEVDSEVTSSQGRSDIVVKVDRTIYIIELKVDVSPEEAIKQIEEKKYAQKYSANHKYDSYSIVAIAIEFNSKTREVKNSMIKTMRTN